MPHGERARKAGESSHHTDGLKCGLVNSHKGFFFNIPFLMIHK
jgi:hypothetical protein